MIDDCVMLGYRVENKDKRNAYLYIACIGIGRLLNGNKADVVQTILKKHDGPYKTEFLADLNGTATINGRIGALV